RSTSPFGATLNWAQGSAGFCVDWDKPCKEKPAINNPVSNKHDKHFIEHLLLGSVREGGSVVARFVRDATVADLRNEITSRMTVKEKVDTSVDLPLSNECKRILAYTAEEAERLNSANIGPEHLLRGMLREEKSMAAQVLYGHGLKLAVIREELARDP